MKKQLFFFAALLLMCSLTWQSAAQQFWIVGGQYATEGQYPWVADYRTDNSHSCGGALIAPQWVLTAAHCGGFPGFPTGVETIRLNSINTTASVVNPNGGVDVAIAQKFPHAQFSFSSIFAGYDIMLLKLDTPVTTIQPIDLIDAGDSVTAYQTGNPVQVAGWGFQNSSTSSNPDTLKWVTTKVYDFGQCQTVVGNTMPNRMFCLGYSVNETPSGAAQGDSGGPAWVIKDGVQKQVGIVSGGLGSYTGADSPGYFTKVAMFRDWIDSVINANSSPVSVRNINIPDYAVGLSEHNGTLTFHIGDFKQKTLFVKIMGINGAVIRKEQFDRPAFSKETMDLGSLGNGMYVVHMSDESGRFLTKKIFKY